MAFSEKLQNTIRNTKKKTERLQVTQSILYNYKFFPSDKELINFLIFLGKDEDEEIRKITIEAIKDIVPYVSEGIREQMWKLLLQLARDKKELVALDAITSLWGICPYHPQYKKEELLVEVSSIIAEIDIKLIEMLFFSMFFIFCNLEEENKVKSWVVFHQLVDAEKIFVRKSLARLFKYLFAELPEDIKEQAWDDFRQLVDDKEYIVKTQSAKSFGEIFGYLPKEILLQAWEVFRNLLEDHNHGVREAATKSLGFVFEYLQDKILNVASEILLRLLKDHNHGVREAATKSLGFVFQYLPDEAKNTALEILLNYLKKRNRKIREIAAGTLCKVLKFLSTVLKKNIWRSLKSIIDALPKNRVFRIIDFREFIIHLPPDEDSQALNFVLNCSKEKKSDARRAVARILGQIFSFLPTTQTKIQTWLTLTHLMKDPDFEVRIQSAQTLEKIYQYLPDDNLKLQAWELLNGPLREDRYLHPKIRVGAICKIMQFLPPNLKEQAWKTLQEFLKPKGEHIPWRVAGTLGLDEELQYYITDLLGDIFQYLPKDGQLEALEGLGVLSKEKRKEKNLVYSTLYSLGKISIYMASIAENEDIFKKELENALSYFKESSYEGDVSHRLGFCLPFYQAFYSITFEENEVEDQVQNYILQARKVLKRSKIKKKLLDVIEKLAKALENAKTLKIEDFEERKSTLARSKLFCEQAVEILDTTESLSPNAAKVIRRGLPLVDQKIKRILLDIQMKAMQLFSKMQGTTLESLSLEIQAESIQLSPKKGIDSQSLGRLLNSLTRFSNFLPPSNEKSDVQKKLDDIACGRCSNVFEIIPEILDLITENIVSPRFNNVSISPRAQQTVTIAAIQLNVELFDTFPPKIKNIENLKIKYLSSLAKATKEGANIILFPELSMSADWMSEIKKESQGMIVIPGSAYDEGNHNVCQPIIESQRGVPSQLKINPSPFEESKIMGQRMIPGERCINIYDTKFGKFAVLICRDFGVFVPFLRNVVDIIFVPSYNKAIKRFNDEANNHVINSPSYVIFSNPSCYGGTGIFGQLDREYFDHLVDGGCKEKGDYSLKLCSIPQNKEGMIIADLDLVNKTPSVSKPINSKHSPVTVGHIRFIDL